MVALAGQTDDHVGYRPAIS